jgi:hypothetical protein
LCNIGSGQGVIFNVSASAAAVSFNDNKLSLPINSSAGSTAEISNPLLFNVFECYEYSGGGRKGSLVLKALVKCQFIAPAVVLPKPRIDLKYVG